MTELQRSGVDLIYCMSAQLIRLFAFPLHFDHRHCFFVCLYYLPNLLQVMRLLTAFLLLIYSYCSSAQDVHYSHQPVRNGNENAVQLIANIGATHHLLIMKNRRKPRIYVYDQSLQLKSQKEVPVKTLKQSGAQIFPLKDRYYLFLQSTETGVFHLWMIEENGSSKNMTPVLKQLTKEGFLHEGVQVHLFTDSIHLHALTFTKKDSGQLQLKHVLFSGELTTAIHHEVNLPDTSREEILQQVKLVDDYNLLLLRSIVNNKEENILEVRKCNLLTKETEATRFNFNSRRILRPEILFNAVDSSIVVHSIIMHPVNDYWWALFVSRIKKLGPDVVPRLLPTISSPFCYVFMNGADEHWFDYSNPWQSKVVAQNYKNLENNMGLNERMLADSNSFANRFLVKGYTQYYGSALYPAFTNSTQFYFPSSNSRRNFENRFYFSNIQFLIIDRQNKLANKTASFGGNAMEVNPQETGIARWKNKSLLIMKQIIRKNTKGLVMIYYDQQLKTVELPVYEHYDYLLRKMKAANDGSIIIPYINKKETGLAKLHWEEIEER